MTQTTPELLELLGKLLDSRVDTVGDSWAPKSLVDTFWLNKIQKTVERMYDRI